MLIITNDVAEAIRAQGSAEYPHECCGLLLGTVDDPKRTTVAWPVSNAWTQDVALTATEDEHSLRDRFYIPPKAYSGRPCGAAAGLGHRGLLPFASR